MAAAVQDLLNFHERLTPFLQFLQNVLRDNRVHSADTVSCDAIFGVTAVAFKDGCLFVFSGRVKECAVHV